MARISDSLNQQQQLFIQCLVSSSVLGSAIAAALKKKLIIGAAAGAAGWISVAVALELLSQLPGGLI